MTAALATLRGSDDIACRDADPAAFFTAGIPRREGAPDRATRENLTATAWRYCHGCPLLRVCAAAADDRMEVGLWGGALRRRTHINAGDYLVDPLIPSAPPSRHTQTGEAAA